MNLIDPIPTHIKTERLALRRCEPSFVEGLYAAATESVDTIYPFLPWCHPGYQRSEAEEWLAETHQTWGKGQYQFSIFLDQRLVGGCGVNFLDEHPVANLGYWVRSSEVGNGYASEATQGLADFAMGHCGVKRLEIIMATHNGPSRQVAIKVGASFEGTLRHRLELHGTLYDAYLYSLTGT